MNAILGTAGVYALVIVGVQVLVVVGAICAMVAASRSGAILRRVTELEERVRQLGRPGGAASDPHAADVVSAVSRPMSALEQLEAQAEANRRADEERKQAKRK